MRSSYFNNTEMRTMHAWFVEHHDNQSMPLMSRESQTLLLGGDTMNDVFQLGRNFSFLEFQRIVEENRRQLHWFDQSIEVPLICAYVIIMLFGLIGNGCICYVIMRCKSLRTARNMFIINLAASDMVMCLLCMPFTLVKLLLKNWTLGDAMCRMVPWLQAVNVFSSTITITAIALDRYHVIVSPSAYKVGKLS